MERPADRSAGLFRIRTVFSPLRGEGDREAVKGVLKPDTRLRQQKGPADRSAGPLSFPTEPRPYSAATRSAYSGIWSKFM